MFDDTLTHYTWRGSEFSICSYMDEDAFLYVQTITPSARVTCFKCLWRVELNGPYRATACTVRKGARR
jgi:hypothetical protein